MMTSSTRQPIAVNGSTRRGHILWYVIAVFAWTWGLLGIAWLSGASATELPTSWLRLLAGLGPIVATATLLRWGGSHTREQRVRFWRRVSNVHSVRPHWWIVTALAAAGPAIVVWCAVTSRGFDLSGAPAVAGIVAFAVAAALAEEPGWRGYALDRVRRHRPTAAVVIAAMWMAWHLPLYAIDGTFQHDELGFGTALFCIFTTALVPQTILMIWILDHTRPSILPAIAFHAFTNISGELFSLTTGQQAARLAIWVALAVPIVTGWLRHPPSSHTRTMRPPRQTTGPIADPSSTWSPISPATRKDTHE